VIAVYLGASQALYPVLPTMIVAGELSVAMLYESQRVGVEPEPYRGMLSRIIMAVGGLLFLGHSLRVLGFLLFVQLGLLSVSAHLSMIPASASNQGRLWEPSLTAGAVLLAADVLDASPCRQTDPGLNSRTS
jgi:hypothetical protein